MKNDGRGFVRPGVRVGDAPIVIPQGRGLVYRERLFVPLWISLLQAVVTTLWRTARRILRTAVRHPAVATVGVALVVVDHSTGTVGLTVLVVLVALAVTGWRVRWPGSFDRHVTTRARSWWRFRSVYRGVWRDLMDGCGLVDPTADGETFPRIASLTSARDRDELVVVLPYGQVPDDLATQSEALTHGLGVHEVVVKPFGRGRVRLTVHRTDPLHHPLPPPDDAPRHSTGEDLDAGRVGRRLAAVTVGRTDTDRPWTLDLRPGHHLLISGTTGSGKSGLLWAILWDLTDLIRTGWVTVTGLDPKHLELRTLATAGLGDVHTDITTMPDVLEGLVTEMDDRCRRIAGRQHVPSVGEPVRLIVIDELATLTALASAKVRARVEDALGHLLQRGRAAGYEVVITSVEATKDVVRWRGLCSTRVCYRTDDDGAADLTLGDGAHDLGAATELIPHDMPGIAYARIDGRRDITRVRTHHLTDAHLARLTTTAAAVTSEAPDVETCEVEPGTATDVDTRTTGARVIPLRFPFRTGLRRPGPSTPRSLP